MNLLLDTCAMIWCVSEPRRLSTPVCKALMDPENRIFVSAISCAEVACLAEDIKITVKPHWRTWFNKALSDNGWAVVDIDLEIIQEAFALPDVFHRDPADRIIVATARLRHASVVTSDRKILDYPHVNCLTCEA